MKRRRIYLAHCLSGPTEAEMAANRLDAKRWGCWLAKTFDVAVVMDWMWMSEIWTEAEGRKLGLEIDKALIDGCSGVFMCGPRISEGMIVEKNHALNERIAVYGCCFQPLESVSEGDRIAIGQWLDELPGPSDYAALLRQQMQTQRQYAEVLARLREEKAALREERDRLLAERST